MFAVNCYKCATIYDTDMVDSCPKCGGVAVLTSQETYKKGAQCYHCGETQPRELMIAVGCVNCSRMPYDAAICAGCHTGHLHTDMGKIPGRWWGDTYCFPCLRKWYLEKLNVQINGLPPAVERTIAKAQKIKRCGCAKISRVLVSKIAINGRNDISAWCLSCGGQSEALKHAEIKKEGVEISKIVTVSDRTMENTTICAVVGCENKGQEYHHFAPKHLFNNAGDWPAAYLCNDHHREWHKKTRTGSYYK